MGSQLKTDLAEWFYDPWLGPTRTKKIPTLTAVVLQVLKTCVVQFAAIFQEDEALDSYIKELKSIQQL